MPDRRGFFSTKGQLDKAGDKTCKVWLHSERERERAIATTRLDTIGNQQWDCSTFNPVRSFNLLRVQGSCFRLLIIIIIFIIIIIIYLFIYYVMESDLQ